ncbi:hypothetical protein SDC9_167037 [bioreactor metagenome]|uniref:Uncharacterized protein n=1 Tax=bioreactor metagenome TaxID=1076179 RepID=A0A645FZ19_9ZZZZ
MQQSRVKAAGFRLMRIEGVQQQIFPLECNDQGDTQHNEGRLPNIAQRNP